MVGVGVWGYSHASPPIQKKTRGLVFFLLSSSSSFCLSLVVSDTLRFVRFVVCCFIVFFLEFCSEVGGRGEVVWKRNQRTYTHTHTHKNKEGNTNTARIQGKEREKIKGRNLASVTTSLSLISLQKGYFFYFFPPAAWVPTQGLVGLGKVDCRERCVWNVEEGGGNGWGREERGERKREERDGVEDFEQIRHTLLLLRITPYRHSRLVLLLLPRSW